MWLVALDWHFHFNHRSHEIGLPYFDLRSADGHFCCSRNTTQTQIPSVETGPVFKQSSTVDLLSTDR